VGRLPEVFVQQKFQPLRVAVHESDGPCLSGRDDMSASIHLARLPSDTSLTPPFAYSWIGCHPNRTTLDTITRSKLTITDARRGQVSKAPAIERPMGSAEPSGKRS
jgi:hypothetical protein